MQKGSKKTTARKARTARASGRRSPLFVVGVGSTRGPKVEAARRVLTILKDKCPDFAKGELRLIARAMNSGTASTPGSTAELMTGARFRAQRLFESLRTEGRVPNLCLGLEGGILSEKEPSTDQPVIMLESWAYATDGVHGYFGSGGCLPLPTTLARAVMENQEELGDAADRLYGQADVAGQKGTFGILTADLVTREDAFLRSLLHAIAPFYNSSSYALREPDNMGVQHG